jgi:hypothetical protein
MLSRKSGAFVAVLAAALAAQSCSHYGFSPAGRGGTSTVAIPIFANETLEYGAEQDLTDALIEEFTDDNSMRVVPEEEAESIIRGVVIAYERPVLSYDAGGSPREYRVRVVARIAYENLSTKETVWEADVEGWAIYAVTAEGGGLTSEDEAREVAFEKLAQDVLSKTVQGW